MFRKPKPKRPIFVIGPPLLQSDVSILIGLKQKRPKIEIVPEIETVLPAVEKSVVETKIELDLSDIDSIKEAVFKNEGLTSPVADLAQYPLLFLGRKPLKSELEDIKLYAEDKNIKKLTEKVSFSLPALTCRCSL